MVQLEKQVHHMEKDILFISEMEETYQWNLFLATKIVFLLNSSVQKSVKVAR